MGKVGNLKRLVVALGATAAVLIAAAVSGAAPAPVDVKIYDQCANGDPSSTSTSCPAGWINGILQANNSHYAEDEVTPQRLVLELEKNSATTDRTVEISYLTRKGGAHAYDSLATWNYTQTSADHCQDLPGSVPCPSGSPTTFPIPLDTTVVADSNGSGSATSAHQLTGQVFTMYGGTITSVSSYTHDDAAGSSDSYAHVTITYSVPSTADGPQVMLLFGGHLAPSLGPRGWGVGVGSGSISGGPYHIRITAADGGSVGARDNQIMSSAILSPANILIKKVAVGGDGTFDYTATGGISSNFSITTSGGNGSQAFSSITPGTYTVTESAPPAGWDFTNLVCVDEDGGSSVDLGQRKATIDLDPGETVTCTYTNTKRGKIIIEKQTLPDGSPQLFTFTRSYGSNVQLSDGQQNESGLLAPGTYSVSETVPSGWTLTSSTCDDGSSPSAISLQAGETVKCTFNNAQNGQVIVKKVMVGGTDTFNYTGTPNGAISVNNGTISQAVAPGQYTSTEAAKAGWDLSSISCSDGNSSGSVANRQATFNVEAGETVTCTFTNTKQGQVIVKKVMVGGTDSFDYSGTPAGTISSNNGTISANVAPGQYTSTEAAKSGWDLTAVSCDDGNSSGSVANRQATFNVEAGETVTCTFTNTKQGQVIVKKVMVGGTDTFSYTGTPSGSISVNNGTISANVAPGAYSSAEDAKAGWSLTSIACDDGNSSGNVGTRTANFNVEAGETVTCTFTNTKQGQVIVKKVMVGGTDTFNYTGTPSGAIAANNGTISASVTPGQHVSTESAKAGWDLTSVVCDDTNSVGSVANRQATFNLEPGETVTCTFTNTKQGQVVVKKVMVGGTDSFDYSGTPSGSIVVNNGTVSASVAPGQYVSTEAAKSGWDLTAVACDDGNSVGSVANRQATFNVAAGEVVTCTFTNTKRGQIVVEKQTIPNGDEATFGFTGEIVATLGDGQSSSKSVEPGTYTVDEAAKAGWDLTSIVCDDSNSSGSLANRRATFNVAAGEVVKCTFTNTKRGAIIVEKQTNPNGDPQVFGFNASYNPNGFSLSDGQSNDSGALAPGTYSVSETVPAGWDLESATCSDGSQPGSIGLAAGETVTCVFTNEKDAVIIVEKQTNPNGDPQSFGFNASYDGDGFSLADGQSNNSGDLDPGTYSVSENVPQGWDLESAVCSDESNPSSIALAAGETVTCVFTNTKRGSIIVEKQTSPNGAAGSFGFSGDAAGSIGDNGQIVVPNLVPGTYTSTEAEAEGWSLTSISCNDANSTGSLGSRTATFSLEAGETVKCTFTNAKLGQGSISVSKSANPTSVKEPGGQVTYSVTITNTSADVDVHITNVVDDKFGDLDDSGGNGCFDVPINLAPGEKVNCTFQRTITGVGGTSHVNVVTASGTDEAGNPVSASDDAKVDITPRLIDLVIVKEASSPTPLNGIVNYSLTVTNKGPDTATNVQLADPAPAGITYLTANPSQGTCNVSPSLITCSLGNIVAGQTVTINMTGRATAVGSHTNTATVTGSGGRETNAGDNVDSAVTVVPAPLKPPAVKPPPEPEVCLALTVSPKMIKADGKPDKVTVKVTAGSKRVKGVKVIVSGAGVSKTAKTNGKGVAVLRINPKKPGLITITVLETNQKLCGPKRIGVVGVFLPPLTG